MSDLVDTLGINGLFLKLNKTFKGIQIGIDAPGYGVIWDDFDFNIPWKDDAPYFLKYVHFGLLGSKEVILHFKLSDVNGYEGNENQFKLFIRNLEITLNNYGGNCPLNISFKEEKP